VGQGVRHAPARPPSRASTGDASSHRNRREAARSLRKGHSDRRVRVQPTAFGENGLPGRSPRGSGQAPFPAKFSPRTLGLSPRGRSMRGEEPRAWWANSYQSGIPPPKHVACRSAGRATDEAYVDQRLQRPPRALGLGINVLTYRKAAAGGIPRLIGPTASRNPCACCSRFFGTFALVNIGTVGGWEPLAIIKPYGRSQ